VRRRWSCLQSCTYYLQQKTETIFQCRQEIRVRHVIVLNHTRHSFNLLGLTLHHMHHIPSHSKLCFLILVCGALSCTSSTLSLYNTGMFKTISDIILSSQDEITTTTKSSGAGGLVVVAVWLQLMLAHWGATTTLLALQF
jgi:hypothetical protein